MDGRGSPTASTGCPPGPPKRASSMRSWPTLVSWYSGRRTTRDQARSGRPTPGAVHATRAAEAPGGAARPAGGEGHLVGVVDRPGGALAPLEGLDHGQQRGAGALAAEHLQHLGVGAPLLGRVRVAPQLLLEAGRPGPQGGRADVVLAELGG